MKPVFESSTGLDAHMILNLLQQSGIDGRIDGEHLQGGIGELSPLNVVRVLVENQDYERAQAIVKAWESTQPQEPREETAKRRFFNTVNGFLLGLLVGIGGMYWWYSTPLTSHGIDHNGDGVLDETWTYSGDRIAQSESDRNLDGVVDLVFEYDHRGIVQRSSSDDDFDGHFETSTRFRNGNAYASESDFDEDGFVDYRAMSRHGVVETVEILDSTTRAVIKRQHFTDGRLSSAEHDSTGDGTLDACYEYDTAEEIIGVSAC